MGKSHRSHNKNAKGPTPQLRSRNTRSSKGRLLTETASSTILLTNQLSLLGLYPAPTIGDGNCLFRALSDQLHGSPSKHLELRQRICDHIERFKSRYEPFVEDERGLEGHLRAMRETSTYGGHLELSAFAHWSKRNVKVVQPGLVYVIEWNAAGGEEGPTSALAAGLRANTSDQIEMPTTPRPSKSVSPTKAKEEKKIKLGKGYYVYEEISSDEEQDSTVKVEEVEQPLEGGGPTIYVAYHDWEHFSSIRNLRGPHSGLPNIVETPPPPGEDQEQQPITAKEREKQRERERKKERELKEKERKNKERERSRKEAEQGTSAGPLKVKLKLPPSVPAVVNTNPDVYLTPGTDPSSSSLTLGASSISDSQPLQDPSLIPLPISRSSSPFISSSSSLVPSSAPSPLPTSSLANEVYPEDLVPGNNAHISSLVEGYSHRHAHAHVLQTPRSQYRSPKRTFDESSASGGEDNAEKRSRRRVESTESAGRSSGTSVNGATTFTSVSKTVGGEMMSQEEEDGGETVVMLVDVDKADNDASGAVSAHGSSSSSPLSSLAPSVASSVSGGSSDVEVDDDDDDVALESQVDDNNDDDEVMATSPDTNVSQIVMPDGLSQKERQTYLHLHLQHGDNKPLTRRERKKLGLPKPQRGFNDKIPNVSTTTSNLSAGKIVIPGGKWKGRNDGAGQSTTTTTGGVGSHQIDGEWRKNGAGRLDVRGFRELKI